MARIRPTITALILGSPLAVAAAPARATDWCVQNGDTPAVACPATFDAAHVKKSVFAATPSGGTALVPGDTVQIEPGTYAESVAYGGVTGVVFKGDPAHAQRPVITSSSGYTLWINQAASGTTLRHLDIRSTGGTAVLAGDPAGAANSDVTLDDVAIASDNRCVVAYGALAGTNISADQSGALTNPCIELDGGAANTLTGLTLHSTAPASAAVLAANPLTIDGATIDAAGDSAIRSTTTLTISRAAIHAGASGILEGNDGRVTLHNSLVTSSTPAAIGVHVGGKAFGDLRNDTIVLAGAGSTGVLINAQPPGNTFGGSAGVSNSIVRTAGTDLVAEPDLGATFQCGIGGISSCDGFVGALNSNYATGSGATDQGANQHGDPLFVSATDLHVRKGSPAIDAGRQVPDGDVDLDGVARPKGAAPDLGAYESNYAPDTPPSGGGGGGGTTPPPGGGPGGSFKLAGTAVGKRGTITLTLSAPSAGRVSARATTKTKRHRRSKTIAYGSGAVSAPHAGRVTLVIRPGAAAKRALSAAGRLRVSIAIAFTPNGGTAAHTKTVVTVRTRRRHH